VAAWFDDGSTNITSQYSTTVIFVKLKIVALRRMHRINKQIIKDMLRIV